MSSRYSYIAVDAKGSEVAGELTASTKKEALVQLSSQALTVLELSAEQTQREDEGPGARKPGEQAITLALYELASMLKAGVGAAEAVSSQAQSAAHPALRWAFKKASKTLRHGGTFEQAIEASELQLPRYVIYLIRAGEVTGRLGDSLADACAQMEYDLATRNDIRNALIYPVILVVSGVLSVLMMFVFVLPSFSNLLEQADRLPFLAWAVLASGKWANENILLLLVLLSLPPVLFVIAWRTPVAKLKILEVVERIPVVGDWVSHADVAAWSKVMSSLIKHRVELLLALDLAVQAVKMPSRKRRMGLVTKAVRAGEMLSVALEENACLTDTGYNLVRVGERSGQLEAMLTSLAALYTEQGKQRMKKVLALIEPIAILLIGSAMGTIIIGVMLAITSANDIPF
ncbi:MAG: type II secretion system F family protein [Spongiibacteraceae bacterium]